MRCHFPFRVIAFCLGQDSELMCPFAIHYLLYPGKHLFAHFPLYPQKILITLCMQFFHKLGFSHSDSGSKFRSQGPKITDPGRDRIERLCLHIHRHLSHMAIPDYPPVRLQGFYAFVLPFGLLIEFLMIQNHESK